MDIDAVIEENRLLIYKIAKLSPPKFLKIAKKKRLF